mmetsp:Transcript_36593/g.49514  ORF Transcript_36593/g.49514 Transcript_36593/m.49514 type:complete len:94 (+) Transcript_36593:418-699(+)
MNMIGNAARDDEYDYFEAGNTSKADHKLFQRSAKLSMIQSLDSALKKLMTPRWRTMQRHAYEYRLFHIVSTSGATILKIVVIKFEVSRPNHLH